MKYRIVLFCGGGLFLLVALVFFSHGENPENSLKEYVVDPIPSGLKIVHFKASYGIGRSQRFYQLMVDEDAWRQIHGFTNAFIGPKEIGEISERSSEAYKLAFGREGRIEISNLSGYRKCTCLYGSEDSYNQRRVTLLFKGTTVYVQCP